MAGSRRCVSSQPLGVSPQARFRTAHAGPWSRARKRAPPKSPRPSTTCTRLSDAVSRLRLTLTRAARSRSGVVTLLRALPRQRVSANLQPNGCRYDDRGSCRPCVPRPGRPHPPRHSPSLRRGSLVLIAVGHGLSDELRGRAKARRGAGTGRLGHEGTPRPGAARAHRSRCSPAGAAGPRPARDGMARASGPNGRAAHAGPRPESEPTEERARHMSVTSIEKDFDRLTLVVVADFDATPERVWQLWADPRKLERWWGPPSYPATVQQYDLTPGGGVRYFMTGPEGEKYRGWWRVTSVNPPKSLEFRDGFADQDGNPAPDMPTTMVSMQLTEHGGGTRMELRTVFDTREAMERLASMGMTEGMREAVGQMDALLGG